ncbi:MAG: cupin domain-containing protein [Acidimicrobiales bacterium]
MTHPFQLVQPDDLVAHRIAADDTVRLAVIAGPADGLDHTVVFEVWDPGGSQPPNSHPRSVETFLILSGSGTAYSDHEQARVSAGDFLVLPAGTTHRIQADDDAPLVAITTMIPDDGFAAMIDAGPVAALSDEERAVLAGGVPGGPKLYTS